MGKAKAVRRQRLFESKDSSKAKTKAILRQRPFKGKGKGPSKARALRMQRPYDDKGKRRPKAKCELYDCNKQTSSFLAITPVLVRLGRRCCVTGESMSGIFQRLKLKRWSSLKLRMWSIGFKEKALRRQREGHLEGKDASMKDRSQANALRR